MNVEEIKNLIQQGYSVSEFNVAKNSSLRIKIELYRGLATATYESLYIDDQAFRIDVEQSAYIADDDFAVDNLQTAEVGHLFCMIKHFLAEGLVYRSFHDAFGLEHSL